MLDFDMGYGRNSSSQLQVGPSCEERLFATTVVLRQQCNEILVSIALEFDEF